MFFNKKSQNNSPTYHNIQEPNLAEKLPSLRDFNPYDEHKVPQYNYQVASHGRFHISGLEIEGFRSIRSIQLEFQDFSVLFGASASGKSNLLLFFEMMGWMLRARNLQGFVKRNGGVDCLMYDPPSESQREIRSHIIMENFTRRNEYRFSLDPVDENTFSFMDEGYRYTDTSIHATPYWKEIGNISGNGNDRKEAGILNEKDKTAQFVLSLLKNCTVYHFKESSCDSIINMLWNVQDSHFLRSDGGNLGPFLMRLEVEFPTSFKKICSIIQSVFSFFNGFDLHESQDKVLFRWCDSSGKSFPACQTSDSMLHFILLTTLFNTPEECLSYIILVDEPEIGLHGEALQSLGEGIQKLAGKKQLIITTKSDDFVKIIQPEQVITL